MGLEWSMLSKRLNTLFCLPSGAVRTSKVRSLGSAASLFARGNEVLIVRSSELYKPAVIVAASSRNAPSHTIKRGLLKLPAVATTALALGLAACTHPHNIDPPLKSLPPEAKVTSFSQAIMDLGLMTEIYGAQKLNLMVKEIADQTGSSLASQAEIPRDVTEMLKSTLNAVGGKVVYVPFDPDFIVNAANTGYSGFDQKVIPDIVMTGGITEFDRGLETRGRNTDLSIEGSISKQETGVEFSDQQKDALSAITLDFNMIDFKTLTGVPRMQASNTIKVHKVLEEDSIGFSINGNAIGFKGTVKKVQGRHAAVRLLVQLSMMQVVGKYLKLPYWRLLPGVEPDPVVINQVVSDFQDMDAQQRVVKFQEYLNLNGYQVSLTGQFDPATVAALTDFSSKHSQSTNQIDQETYLALYDSVPITHDALRKRRLLDSVSQNKLAGGNAVLSADGQLRIWTQSDRYRIGEKVKIFFEVSTPMYVRIMNISSSGEINELFPNEFQRDNLLRPGTNYQIPPENDPFTLDVTGPSGTDRIIAFASPRPIASTVRLLDDSGVVTAEAASLPTQIAVNIAIE